MKDKQDVNLHGEIRRIDPRDMPNGMRAISLSVLVKEKGGIAWFRCTAFGALAEELERDAHLSQRIAVSGTMLPGQNGNPKIWERDGKTYSNYEVRIDTCTLGETNETTTRESGDSA